MVKVWWKVGRGYSLGNRQLVLCAVVMWLFILLNCPPPESTFLGLKQGVRLGHRYRGFGYKGLDVD